MKKSEIFREILSVVCDFAEVQESDVLSSKRTEEVTSARCAIIGITKEGLELMFKNAGIELQTKHIYDALYVANMAKADFYGSSIADELHLVRYVSDYINDPDGYEGMPFVRFYADTCMKDDCTVYWEDML